MEQLTLWSEVLPVSRSRLPESEKVLKELLDSCSSTYVVFKSLCLGGSCGKTSRERSRVRGGAAFGQLLREMDALGYGLAWRVLDAQFFGVAQRRERLFLVGHLGDARACEVLFEPESMCWDTPSSREKRKAVAAASGRCVAQGGGTGRLNLAVAFKYHQGSKAGGIGDAAEQSPTLTADYHNPAVMYEESETCTAGLSETGQANQGGAKDL